MGTGIQQGNNQKPDHDDRDRNQVALHRKKLFAHENGDVQIVKNGKVCKPPAMLEPGKCKRGCNKQGTSENRSRPKIAHVVKGIGQCQDAIAD